ncbi:hypothetical protein WN944_003487 [Citrus x changshan-huyou]|uniref:Uncharacterized protein n=1 Tax=Citrus x changshan-huyou TaxID=2935761 RepID=A0AAP0QI15_9ROSI
MTNKVPKPKRKYFWLFVFELHYQINHTFHFPSGSSASGILGRAPTVGDTFKPVPQPRLEVPARTERHRFSQQSRLPCDSNWGANPVKPLKGTPLPVESTLCFRELVISKTKVGLRIIPSPRRPVRLVSWLRSPLGVVKLSRDGCSGGSPEGLDLAAELGFSILVVEFDSATIVL